MEYLPARGSRDKSRRYSRDQIKRLIQGLVDRQLLVRLHTSGLRERMVFKLPLAHCDLNRPTEERQQSATKAAPQLKPHSKRDVEQNPTTSAPHDERHLSEISDKNSLSMREGVSVFCIDKTFAVVDGDAFKRKLAVNGVDVDLIAGDFQELCLEEFVDFWSAKPDVVGSQVFWEGRFLDSVIYHVNKGVKRLVRAKTGGRAEVTAAVMDVTNTDY